MFKTPSANVAVAMVNLDRLPDTPEYQDVRTNIRALLCILNVTTKNRHSFLILITTLKMPNLSLMPLKPSCHPQHDLKDAVLKYAIALLNK